ncbi:unnamed protein product [Lathyrus sativus]|nr:unnamed protein product [Lathyrus sativus]
MNVVSYNNRGCGRSIKRRRITKIIEEGKTDMCFIQETKIQNLKEEDVKSIWGKVAFGWSAFGARGSVGAMLTVWRVSLIQPILSFKVTRLLVFNVVWKAVNCYFVNVYSLCDMGGKRRFWVELIEWKRKLPEGEWLVREDYNAIKSLEEKKGSRKVCWAYMYEFDSFIDMMELTNVPVVGSRYTWFKDNGCCKSRIDRMLIFEGLVLKWIILSQEVGSKRT